MSTIVFSVYLQKQRQGFLSAGLRLEIEISAWLAFSAAAAASTIVSLISASEWIMIKKHQHSCNYFDSDSECEHIHPFH